MVTFNDAVADADAAREALRGLAHATRTLPEPADSYPVLASLASGLAALRRSLDQLADWHSRSTHLATDDAGDCQAGRQAAAAAADHLRTASTQVEKVRKHIDQAWNHNSGIAWHPDTPRSHRPKELPSFGTAPVSRRDENGISR